MRPEISGLHFWKYKRSFFEKIKKSFLLRKSRLTGYVRHFSIQAQKIKKNTLFFVFFFKKAILFSLKFHEMEHSGSKPKTTPIFFLVFFLIFQDGTFKAWKTKKVNSEEICYMFQKNVLLAFQDYCWSSPKMKKIPNISGLLVINHKIKRLV